MTDKISQLFLIGYNESLFHQNQLQSRQKLH